MNLLEQRNQIFETAEIEPVLPGEEEVTEIAFKETTRDMSLITCPCPECTSEKRKLERVVKVQITSKPLRTKFATFTRAFETQSKKAIERERENTAVDFSREIEKQNKLTERLSKLSQAGERISLSEMEKINKERESSMRATEKLSKELNRQNGAIERISEKRTREALLAMMKDERVQDLMERGDNLSVILKPMRVTGTLIGPLELRFPPTGIPQVHSTVDSHLSRNGFWHPHVQKNGAVCLGDVEKIARTLFYRQDLSQRFEILSRLLDGYNPGSPHERITAWSPLFCTNCGESMKVSQGRRCECGAVLCKNCSGTLKAACCGKSFCPQCCKKCTLCRLYVCEPSLITRDSEPEGCEICGTEGCGLCIQTCCVCDSTKFICKNCGFQCKKCMTITCKDCAKPKTRKDGKVEFKCKNGHKNIVTVKEEDKIKPIKILQKPQGSDEITVRAVRSRSE